MPDPPSAAAGPARLILLRHGETVWNSERRYTTRSDVELAPAGVAQAKEAADALAGEPLARIVCSPMRRAHATAEAVAARQPGAVPIETDERLVEIDAGPFEGQTEAEILAGPFAADFRRWYTDDEPEFPAGTETLEHALARAQAFFDDALRRPGPTLAVTHGSLVRLIVASCVLGAAPARHRRLWLDNGRFAVVSSDGRRPRLVAFNVLDVGLAS